VYSGLLAVFVTIFLAELGDKTQLATLLFAAEGRYHPVLLFLVAGGALIGTTAVAVVLGTAAEQWLAGIPLKLLAGAGFVAIGLWTIFDHFRAVG
jgi:putative Ca2+/H+ antiporter (TMEM165/GDT1 family)